jgi:hypothetical protein
MIFQLAKILLMRSDAKRRCGSCWNQRNIRELELRPNTTVSNGPLYR